MKKDLYIMYSMENKYVYSGTIYEISKYINRSYKSTYNSIYNLENGKTKTIEYKNKKYIIMKFNNLIRSDSND